MSDFNVRSDSVDVEQIMRQIRTRIREKRGVDYTEEEIRELASVKLEKFLDPRKVRSDLLDHYRRTRQSSPAPRVPPPENYAFEDDTIYVSSRSAGGRLIGAIRRLLNPLLKLFFNPNPVIHVLNLQSRINTWTMEEFDRVARVRDVREELDALNYEVLNNLVVEITRLGIEVKNLKMRVESIASRLDFDERRARALEGVVQYRTGGTVPADKPGPTPAGPPPVSEGGGEQRRRRRRRRGRRRGGEGSAVPPAAPGPVGSSPQPEPSAPPPAAPEAADGGSSDQ